MNQWPSPQALLSKLGYHRNSVLFSYHSLHSCVGVFIMH